MAAAVAAEVVAVVAPATANMIGKLANGIADDALSTFMLAVTAPVAGLGFRVGDAVQVPPFTTRYADVVAGLVTVDVAPDFAGGVVAMTVRVIGTPILRAICPPIMSPKFPDGTENTIGSAAPTSARRT